MTAPHELVIPEAKVRDVTRYFTPISGQVTWLCFCELPDGRALASWLTDLVPGQVDLGQTIKAHIFDKPGDLLRNDVFASADGTTVVHYEPIGTAALSGTIYFPACFVLGDFVFYHFAASIIGDVSSSDDWMYYADLADPLTVLGGWTLSDHPNVEPFDLAHPSGLPIRNPGGTAVFVPGPRIGESAGVMVTLPQIHSGAIDGSGWVGDNNFATGHPGLVPPYDSRQGFTQAQTIGYHDGDYYLYYSGRSGGATIGYEVVLTGGAGPWNFTVDYDGLMRWPVINNGELWTITAGEMVVRSTGGGVAELPFALNADNPLRFGYKPVWCPQDERLYHVFEHNKVAAALPGWRVGSIGLS